MRKVNGRLLVCCGALALSCVYSGFDKVGENTAVGGNTASGGASAGGATAALGGITATGGADSGGSNLGGSTSLLDGSTAAGGTAVTGGTTSANHTSSGGGGGLAAVDGTNSSGGTSGASGGLATVGNSSTGGVVSLGGTTTTGSSSLTGGATQTGGSKSGGGVPSTGGAIPVGGTQSMGGSVVTGGVPATGGTIAGGAGYTGGVSTTGVVACAYTSTTIGVPSTCCVQNGAYGCSANASVHKVLCVNGVWTSNGDCISGQFCDTRPGGTAGSCQNVLPECTAKNPADAVCNVQTAETCGPDLVSVTNVHTCSGSTPVCRDGTCLCNPTTVQCDSAGTNGVQTCDTNGRWGAPVSCYGTTPLCSGGACVPCPGTDGPIMVGLPLNYCIDSTEVTQAQYQAWLDTSPPISDQPSFCSSWNSSYVPTCNWTPATTANYPVVCVDWCDAYAYCAGVGKRLCGKIGGGSNGYNDYANASLGQWDSACTSNGLNKYPYGNTHQATYCNGNDYWGSAIAEKALPVGSLSTCQSSVAGYMGVYDLSGNVSEWEDSCDGTTGSSDHCHLRGGDFFYTTSALECGGAIVGVRERYEAEIYSGFRCCSPR